jgi:hypothetical protein
VELVGAVDGAGGQQQVERRLLRALGGLHHGLVLGAVLVGLEQDAVELLAHRGGQRPAASSAAHSSICAACWALRSMASSAALTISSGAFLNWPLPARRK